MLGNTKLERTRVHERDRVAARTCARSQALSQPAVARVYAIFAFPACTLLAASTFDWLGATGASHWRSQMHANRSMLIKLAAVGAVAVAALTGAASASAGTSWSIGISAPGVAIGVAEPSPVYYEPAPVYSRPAPVYYQPAAVYYRPAPPAAYAPAPVYYEPGFRGEARRFYRADWDGGRRWDRREWGHERREDRRGWGDRD
jgi:hypothetical protein